jgi:peptide/nickel transport system substrate-binding protein
MFPFRRRTQTTKNLDQQLVFQLSKSRIPSPRQLKYITHFIKGRERVFLYACLGIMVSGLIVLSSLFYRQYIELVPKNGGTYIEAAIGNPQYINPLYSSLNPIDADLDALIFSRLFSTNSKGEVTPDLVESYEISEDSKVYTLTLKEAYWPNEQPITSDDIIFTFNLIQSPNYKSPLNQRFSQVTVSKIDDRILTFTINEPYGRFTNLLNFGILPSALWEGVSPEMMPLAELNLKPVGSGPYQLKSLIKNSTGTIRSYKLERNLNYYNQSPFLEEIIFKFYPSTEEMVAAINNGQVNGVAELPANFYETIIAKNSFNFQTIAKPQLTALFFNTKSKSNISLLPVRQALNIIDRNNIIIEANQRAYIPTQKIIPESYVNTESMPSLQPDEARELLEKNDWKLRTLSEADLEAAKTAKDAGSISQLGAGEWRMKGNQGIIISFVAPVSLKEIAEKIADSWKELGIKIDLKIQEDSALQSQTLANKDFDVLLYGQDMETGDPYPFWTTDGPGNISGYSRSEVDTWLKEARLSHDPEVIADRYTKFQNAVISDLPVIPLFWNAYLYPQTKKLKGNSLTFINTPRDRFNEVYNWYLKVKRKIK